MISRDMNRILKAIPRFPKDTDFYEISKKKIVEPALLSKCLKDALKSKYIEFVSKSPYNDISKSRFYLTEEGQTAIEENKHQRTASKKATWALIISGLSFIASVVAIVVSLCVQ